MTAAPASETPPEASPLALGDSDAPPQSIAPGVSSPKAAPLPKAEGAAPGATPPAFGDPEASLGLPFRLVSLEATTSTNDEVKRALEASEPEGLVMRAKRQTGGYGRQGRAWASPEGGLYMSLLLRPRVEAAALPTLSLVVGLAVRQAAASLVSREAADAVRVKWPNDVVVVAGEANAPQSAKLCGISVEVHAGGVCVGCGVNVLPPAEPQPIGGKNTPAYLADLAAPSASSAPSALIDVACEAILREFAPLYVRWQSEGFAPLARAFNGCASLIGQQVRIANHAGAVTAEGQVVRIDECGRLVIRTSDGTESPQSSGEAHLV